MQRNRVIIELPAIGGLVHHTSWAGVPAFGGVPYLVSTIIHPFDEGVVAVVIDKTTAIGGASLVMGEDGFIL